MVTIVDEIAGLFTVIFHKMVFKRPETLIDTFANRLTRHNNYELTPASIHDAKAAPEVIENCPCPFVIADVGYVGKKLQHIFSQMGYQLWTPYRSNMRFAKQHNSRQLKKIRRRIKSCFADLILNIHLLVV